MFLDVYGRDMERYPKFTGFINQIIMGTSLWMLSNAMPSMPSAVLEAANLVTWGEF
jgi:hypothetical protein